MKTLTITAAAILAIATAAAASASQHVPLTARHHHKCHVTVTHPCPWHVIFTPSPKPSR